jgi:hypothetical protein
MGKASSSKKVARAARAGRGASRRANRGSWVFPGLITVVVVLGVLLIVTSRDDRESDTEPPRLGDHIHAAYGIYLCDDFAPPLSDRHGDAKGIHTHADGLVHIHPISTSATGRRANLGVFADEIDLEVSATSLKLPDQDERENGDKCGNEDGRVQVVTWDSNADETPTVVPGDPRRLKFEEGMLVTVAFAPTGAEIPKPPSGPTVTAPSDVTGQTSIAVPPPAAPTETTAPTEPATDSTAPAPTASDGTAPVTAAPPTSAP